MKETEKLIIRKKQPVITRHKALVAYLLDKNIIKDGEYKLIEHADYKDVMGQDVIGVLPLQLCAYAKSITEVPLNLTPEMRGKELTFEEVEKIAGEPVQYIVREVNNIDGVNYYMDILEKYSDEDYTLAYKYYEHVQVDAKHFKDFTEISKARTIYMDIMNCLYGIFDVYHMELQNSEIEDFVFYRANRCNFEAKLIYKEEYDVKVVSMKEFSKEEVLKFVNDLMNMCL